MPNRSKEKGSRFERRIVQLARSKKLKAFRIPLSGSCAHFKGDVLIDGKKFESKNRAQGFKQLYKWFKDEFYGVIIGSNRKEPLAVIRLTDLLELFSRK